MVSAIDITKPTSGNAQTADVRANFATAKSEIESLQGFASTPYLPLAGGPAMLAPIILPSDPTLPLHAATKQYVDAMPVLPLIGGTLTGNLSIAHSHAYAGEAASNATSALNITQQLSGSSWNNPGSGVNWPHFSNHTITDTVDVNPPSNLLCSFQGSISAKQLTVHQPIAGPPSVTFVGSIAPGGTVTVESGLTGAITAGLTLNWAGGSATIVSGSGQPNIFITPDVGTVTSQAMTAIGPAPAKTLQWGASVDPDNNTTAVISSWTGTPDVWALTTDPGVVALQAMQIVKTAQNQQAIAGWHNLSFGGGNASGGRTGWFFQMTQNGRMPVNAGYQGGVMGISQGYDSGGTDLWRGAAGQVIGFLPRSNMVRRSTTPGVVGAINYQGSAAMECDYGCAAGSPDDPNYPLASTAGIGAATFNRFATHQWVPAFLEGDFAISIGQARSAVTDASGNLLPIRAAKIGIRYGSFYGVWSIDAAQGRAIGAAFGGLAYNVDGTLGPYPMRGRHAIDWYNVDWTGSNYRWQGGVINGSGSPLPGSLQIGGGFLSATNTIVSLDTVGSVCTNAVVAPGLGGANLHAGTVCVADDPGVYVVVLTTDNAVRPGVGAALTVRLIAKGQAHNGALPPNPVQFRATGAPLGFDAPGPTGPQLTLTWSASDTLDLQPSGGRLMSGLLPNAANDTAAAAAGVGLNQWYRNGSVMMQRVA
jgi:hypothetical protein